MVGAGFVRTPPLSKDRSRVDFAGRSLYTTALFSPARSPHPYLLTEGAVMKVRSSLKTLKTRHRDCKLVRRKGRLYVINKTDPRYKARQG